MRIRLSAVGTLFVGEGLFPMATPPQDMSDAESSSQLTNVLVITRTTAHPLSVATAQSISPVEKIFPAPTRIPGILTLQEEALLSERDAPVA